MGRLLPFFTFYGGKNRAAKLYPQPQTDTIVEPFAGSAGYAMNYPDRRVILRDADPIIVGTWEYLIQANPGEILALPDLADGETVDDLDVPQEARWLIGWWLNKGSATPKKSPSTFMLKHPRGGPYWGSSIRDRIARQLPAIRHWTVSLGSYQDSPDLSATWFVDPPYQVAGRVGYRFNSTALDFDDLAAWATSRRGQVIVCEADDAAWLPFRHLAHMDPTEGRQKVKRARSEVIWTRDAGCPECPGCGIEHDPRGCAGATCDCCDALERERRIVGKAAG